MVQNVKNQPAMGETWVQSLGWEDSLEKGTATHSSVMAWRVLWTEEPGRFTVHGVTESDTTKHEQALIQFMRAKQSLHHLMTSLKPPHYK